MIHDDELLSYQISARLSGTSFGFLWTRMSSLGWNYDSKCSEYFTPFGINVGSANEATATLDLFALPPLSFRPNSYDGGYAIVHERYDAETVEKLRISRNDLLKAIFVDYQEREGKTEIGKRRKCEGNTTAISNDQAGRDNLDRGDYIESDIIKTTTSQIDDRMDMKEQNISATRNEPGTEQFFAKQVRRSGRIKHAQISYAHAKADNLKKDDDKNDEHAIRMGEKQKLIFGSSKLVWPNPQECVKALRRRETNSNKSNQDQNSFKLPKKLASEWKFLLSTNHSIILYGFGSKRNLLNEFAEQELSNYGDVLTLDGYDSNISITGILDVIVQSILGGKEPMYTGTTSYKDSLSSDLNCRAIAISIAIARSHPRPIYLVLHNIDGLGLRSQAAQNCLAALVANSSINNAQSLVSDSKQTTNNKAQVIRLITSVDRVDAVEILWDVTCSTKFSWIWKQASTYYPYHDEVMFTITDETRKNKEERRDELDLRFMQKTLSSLAPRHAEVLKVLAQIQLSKSGKNKKQITKGTGFDSVQYKILKKECVKEMVLSSDTDLKNIMNELRDHGMVVKQLDFDTEEIVSIPTSRSKLLEILNLIGGS